MKKFGQKLIIGATSGLVGVIITICYQHFLAKPQAQSFTFVYNGEEIVVTEADYVDLEKQNELLLNENTTLRTQNSSYLQENKELKQNNISKYDIDFQNINLVLNGIETNYNDKVAIINDETYYSIGFLQYLVDSEKVSSNTSKLFIGDIQSDEDMPVSLFSLERFTEGWLKNTTNEEDNYGNTFDEAFRVISGKWDHETLMNNATEYFIDYNYSKFCFDVAYSKNCEQIDYETLIYGDGQLLKSVMIDRKSKIQSIEVDVSNVEFLQIVGKSSAVWGWDGCYSLMVNPYLYP